MKERFKVFEEIGRRALLKAAQQMFKKSCYKYGITHFHTTNIDPSTPRGLVKMVGAIESIEGEKAHKEQSCHP